ncbi:MAG: polysaccharide biosynthesis tyrosine autokinase [Acidobacteria bacterium]|nr:polysaccharide biosynthesis tyrosine autokinase [Acidobacteriota bacterium]
MDTGKLSRVSAEVTTLSPVESESVSVALPPNPLVNDFSSTSDWSDYYRILRKHRWTILMCVLVGTVIATLASLKAVRIYEAVGRIAINRETSDGLGLKNGAAGSDDEYDYLVVMDTQARILQSDSLGLEVMHRLKLDQVNGSAAGLPVEGRLDSRTESALLNGFKGGLDVKPLPRTRIMEIRYKSADPQQAARIINTLIDVYTEQNYKTRFESTMQTSDWISKQLSDLLLKVESSQEKLVQYQREHDILGLDEKQNIITSKLDELNRQLTIAETDRIDKEAIYRLTQEQSPETVRAAEAPGMERLRSSEADLKAQLAEASSQFGTDYPKVKQLNNKLAAVQEEIAAELKKAAQRAKNDYDAALGRESLLHASLEAQKREANKLNESAIQYSILKRDVESNRQLYENLLERLKEAGVAAGLKSSNIRVVDPARAPLAPVSPNVPRNIGVALVLSLIAGVVLAFGFEALDNTVRTVEQVHLLTGLPAIAVIPKTRPIIEEPTRLLRGGLGNRNEAVELVTCVKPHSGIAEAFRALRTSILLSSGGAPPKVILVTSSLSQEGKTTTSVNTAVVLAQKGARVLLIDADLRRPSIHKLLGVHNRVGLSNLLANVAQSADVIIPYEPQPNMFVIPSGPLPPQPAELVASPRLGQLLAQWRKEFDHVVIDTPPCLSVTDAVIMSVEAEAVIVVIRAAKTTKQNLRRTRDLLAGVNAPVRGIVVNAVDMSGPDGHYYYYYYGHDENSPYFRDDLVPHEEPVEEVAVDG